tara:strand:- start:84 stop:257 length:174 start_codon:yes stop_codon:yes gene_type:complete
MNKHEIAPGLYLGSEYGDLSRKIKKLMGQLYLGNNETLNEIKKLAHQRSALLKGSPK